MGAMLLLPFARLLFKMRNSSCKSFVSVWQRLLGSKMLATAFTLQPLAYSRLGRYCELKTRKCSSYLVENAIKKTLLSGRCQTL